MSWQKIDGALTQLAVGRGNNVWGVNFQDEILQYNVGEQTFRKVGGLAVNVGVGADGTVWAINRFDEIFVLDVTGWVKIVGGLVQISVGDRSQVWCVNRGGVIYYRANGTWIIGIFTCINVSVASDGTAWAIDKSRNIFKWNGASWEQIDGKLKQIYTSSASLVVGVDGNNNVFQYKNGQWVQYNDIKLKNVAISIDGNLWGTNPTDEIYMLQPNSTVNLNPSTLTSSSFPSVIIGMGVGFVLALIIFITAILFIIRHYKKSKLPQDGSELPEVVRK